MAGCKKVKTTKKFAKWLAIENLAKWVAECKRAGINMEIHPVSVVDELEGTYEKSSWPHVAARKFKSILRKHISEDSKFYPGSEDDKLLRKIFKKGIATMNLKRYWIKLRNVMFKSKRMCKQFEKRHQNIETFIILCVLIEFLFMCCIYIPMYQYLPYW